MSLFAAGVVLFLLLLASYSGRSFWIALGSIALSMVALAGFLFVATLQDPSQVRPRLAWIASKLHLVLDQQKSDRINKAIAKLPAPAPSPCAAGEETTCGTTASAAVAADTVGPASEASATDAEQPPMEAEPPSTEAEPPSTEF